MSNEVQGTPAPETHVDNPAMETETEASIIDEVLETEANLADEETPKDETPQPRKLKVKIDGQELEVDEDEAARGYQRQADYSRNMQRVQAELQQAQELQARYQQQLEQFIPESLSRIKALTQAANQYRAEGNWEALAAVQYDLQVESSKYHSANNERQQIEDERQKQHQQARHAALKQSEQAVLASIPEWKNQDVMKAEAPEVTKVIVDYVTSNYGEQAQRILSDINDGLYGAMPIVLAREAMLYRKLMGKVAARKAGKSEQTSAPAPVTTVRSSGNASRDPGKMNTEEWMAWRNKQVSKKT